MARGCRPSPPPHHRHRVDGRHEVATSPTPTTTKAFDVISYCFFIANYQSMAAIDTDDVSGYFLAHNNFYSPFGLKADFGGHSQIAHSSVYAYLALTEEALMVP
jgi:hypothetical protein